MPSVNHRCRCRPPAAGFTRHAGACRSRAGSAIPVAPGAAHRVRVSLCLSLVTQTTLGPKSSRLRRPNGGGVHRTQLAVLSVRAVGFTGPFLVGITARRTRPAVRSVVNHPRAVGSGMAPGPPGRAFASSPLQPGGDGGVMTRGQHNAVVAALSAGVVTACRRARWAASSTSWPARCRCRFWSSTPPGCPNRRTPARRPTPASDESRTPARPRRPGRSLQEATR